MKIQNGFSKGSIPNAPPSITLVALPYQAFLAVKGGLLPFLLPLLLLWRLPVRTPFLAIQGLLGGKLEALPIEDGGSCLDSKRFNSRLTQKAFYATKDGMTITFLELWKGVYRSGQFELLPIELNRGAFS